MKHKNELFTFTLQRQKFIKMSLQKQKSCRKHMNQNFCLHFVNK